MRWIVLPLIAASPSGVAASTIAAHISAVAAVADIGIAVEVVIHVDVDVTVTPTAAPSPTASPRSAHRYSNSEGDRTRSDHRAG